MWAVVQTVTDGARVSSNKTNMKVILGSESSKRSNHHLQKVCSNSMRSSWILSIFPILLSAGLLMVIMGQYKELEMLNKRKEELNVLTTKVYTKLQYDSKFKQSLEQLLANGEKTRKDLEAALANLIPQLDSKKKDSEDCQAQAKTENEEMAFKEEEQRKTTDGLNSESESWKTQIDILKATLTGYSPVCAYLKEEKKSLDLCGHNTTT